MKTIVVVPAYNEEKRLENVINKIEQYADQVIVIDDGSSDNTSQLAESFGGKIIVLKHEINLGKGAALKTGCEAACQLNADIIVCMDADGQHKPEDIPRFIEKIEQKNDIVFGSRIIGKGMPFVMFIGNKFLTVIISKLFRIFIHDTQSGYKAFSNKTYEKIKWESTDYAAETEMIIKTAENKLKYTEIEIDTVYHDDYKGTTPVHGLQIFFKILKWKFL